jgi:UDPglucose 6-dehydrogenase
MNISVIGTGYVGLITGLGFAKKGHYVTCVDVNLDKVDMINKGIMPIYEVGAEEILKSTLNVNFKATANLEDAVKNSDITFICVGTPSREDGSINLNYIKNSAESLEKILKNKTSSHLVVVKSTVVPGTTETIVKPYMPVNAGLAMNPEFLREGTAVKDFLEPDRIVYGVDSERSAEILYELYNNFNAPILKTDIKTAEMIKYASNAFLATKISFINEIGNICKQIGIDSYEVAKGMGLDSRIGQKFLNSGIGFGGSCFPKDVNALAYIAKSQGYDTKLLDVVLAINNLQPYRLLELSKDIIKDKSLGVLGLAFKQGTDDIRDSPAIIILNELIKTNKVIAYDPQAIANAIQICQPSNNLIYLSNPNELIERSEVLFVLTDWPEFNDLDYKEKLIFEGKRVLDKKKHKNIIGVCW